MFVAQWITAASKHMDKTVKRNRNGIGIRDTIARLLNAPFFSRVHVGSRLVALSTYARWNPLTSRYAPG